jgi:hypothetical protein
MVERLSKWLDWLERLVPAGTVPVVFELVSMQTRPFDDQATRAMREPSGA